MCSVTISRKENIKKHIECIHEGKKPFSCPVCSSAFFRKRHLQKHIESVHEGKKPFLCHVCSAAFTQKPHLKLHINRVHEGEKPADTKPLPMIKKEEQLVDTTKIKSEAPECYCFPPGKLCLFTFLIVKSDS